jgi:hypothetical protein
VRRDSAIGVADLVGSWDRDRGDLNCRGAFGNEERQELEGVLGGGGVDEPPDRVVCCTPPP